MVRGNGAPCSCYFDSLEFFEDIITVKVRSHFQKRGIIQHVLFLLCAGLELGYCLLRGDFICNHIQAVNNLDPSEVVCLRKCFVNFQNSCLRKIFFYQRTSDKDFYKVLRTWLFWDEWTSVANVWGGWQAVSTYQLPQCLWGPLSSSTAWRLDYCPKFKEGERKHKRGGSKWQKRDNV